MPNAIEQLRRAEFNRNPLLEDFVSTALQDLQLSENDEACTEGREPRDSGTIYTLEGVTFVRLADICDRFAADCADEIAEAIDLEPGEDGLRFGREPMSYERIGSTLWLAVTGSGVTFTDDGDAPCLETMANWARNLYCEGLQFDDEGGIYLIA